MNNKINNNINKWMNLVEQGLLLIKHYNKSFENIPL